VFKTLKCTSELTLLLIGRRYLKSFYKLKTVGSSVYPFGACECVCVFVHKVSETAVSAFNLRVYVDSN